MLDRFDRRSFASRFSCTIADPPPANIVLSSRVNQRISPDIAQR
jgi:hypothetical protein